MDDCCGGSCRGGMRRFISKKEQIEMLSEYKEELENEVQGIKEKIKELEKNN